MGQGAGIALALPRESDGQAAAFPLSRNSELLFVCFENPLVEVGVEKGVECFGRLAAPAFGKASGDAN